MRLIMYIFLVFCLVPHTGQAAEQQEGYSRTFLEAQEQVYRQQDALEKAIDACLASMSSELESGMTVEQSRMDKCIQSKGGNISAIIDPPVRENVYIARPSTATDDLRSQIPEDWGSPASSQEPETPPPLPIESSTPDAEQENQGPNQQKAGETPSSGSKIYLPSRESGRAPKPIFLNR